MPLRASLVELQQLQKQKRRLATLQLFQLQEQRNQSKRQMVQNLRSELPCQRSRHRLLELPRQKPQELRQ